MTQSAKRLTAGSLRTIMPDDALLNRIRSEFLEMPGLRLTRAQAQRLCGVEQTLCHRVLEKLVEANFLCIKPNDMYARLFDGQAPKPHPAKATLTPRSFPPAATAPALRRS